MIDKKEKELSVMLNQSLRTLRKWFSQYPPRRTDDRHLYAMHTLRYAEQLADQFRQADQAGRLAMCADIERLEAEIRIIASGSE